MKLLHKIVDAMGVILFGIVILLNVLNIVPWSIWLGFLSYWPIYIVLFGVSLILDMWEIGKLISKILGFLVFILILALSFGKIEKSIFDFNDYIFLNSVNIELEKGSKSIKYVDEVNTIDVNVKDAVGNFKFTSNDEKNENVLVNEYTYPKYWGEIELTDQLVKENQVINIDRKSVVGKQVIGFGNIISDVGQDISFYPQSHGVNFLLEFGAGEGSVEFSNNLIETFNAQVGAGKLNVDIINSELNGLGIKVGTGESIIDIDDSSKISGEFSINVGVGSLAINLPKGTGYIIDAQVGLGEIDIEDKQFTGSRKVSSLKSENYDSATMKIKINAQVGIGELSINLNK